MSKLPFYIVVEKFTKNTTGNYQFDVQENSATNVLSFSIVPKGNLAELNKIELNLYLTLPINNTDLMQFSTSDVITYKASGKSSFNNQYNTYTITIDVEKWKKKANTLKIDISNFSLTEIVDQKIVFIQQFDTFIEYGEALFQFRFDVVHTAEGVYQDLYKALNICWEQPTYKAGKDSVAFNQFALQDVMTLYKNTNIFENEFKLVLKNKLSTNLVLTEENTRLILSIVDDTMDIVSLEEHITINNCWNSYKSDNGFVLSPKKDVILNKGEVLEISFKRLPVENIKNGSLKLELKGFKGYYDKIDELYFEVANIPEPEVFFDLKSYLDKDKIHIQNNKGREIIEFDYKTRFLQKKNTTYDPDFKIYIKNIGSANIQQELKKIEGKYKYFFSDANLDFLDGKSKQVKIAMEGKGLNGKTATSELVITLADTPSPKIFMDYEDAKDGSTSFDFLEKLRLKCNYKWIIEKNLRLYSVEDDKKDEKKLVDFIFRDNKIEINPQLDLNHIKSNKINLLLESTPFWGENSISENITINFKFPDEPKINIQKKKIKEYGDLIISDKIEIEWSSTHAKFIELIEFRKQNASITIRKVGTSGKESYYIESLPSITFVITPINPLLNKIEQNVFYDLQKGEKLYCDNFTDSKNNQYRLLLTKSGNLIILKKSDCSIVWETNTGGEGVVFAEFQSNDGNFVLYNEERKNAKWALNMENHNGSNKLSDNEFKTINQIMLSDEGILQAKDAMGNVIWCSKKN